jgi:sporulation integral membrane protein YtvI
MLEFYRKYWRTALDIGIIVLTVYLIMWAFSWLYNLAAPILLALVIFVIIEPLARFLHKRGMSKLFATSISVLFYSGIVLALLTGIGFLFVNQTTRLIENLPSYANVFQFHVNDLLRFLRTEWEALPANVTTELQAYASNLSQYAVSFARSVLDSLVNAIGSFSNFVINFAIAFILAFFLSLEANDWNRIAKEKTPNTFKKAFYFLRDNVLKGIVNYIKALLKLMTITFVIIFVSLLILGVDNALAISLLAALLDILPLLGISVLFIPWIIYLFIVGNTWLAVWLTVILVAILALRQILEPRIMGNSLGVSAFTMLALMVLSTSIFGVAGLILSPILTVLIKALYDQGYFKKWIRLPAEEFEDLGAEQTPHAAEKE